MLLIGKILQTIYKASKELLILSLTALDMARLTKIAHVCSMKGKIDLDSLLLSEKTASKPFTRTKYCFYLLSVKVGGWQY